MFHTVPLPADVSRLTDWAGLAKPADTLCQNWLFDTGSLTRRLKQLSAGHFSVTPLRQGLAELREDECQALGLAPGTKGWVREVYLNGRGSPWVFARSVASQQALGQDDFPLTVLGSRSLGELLFVEGGFSRGPIETCLYPTGLLPGSPLHNAPWARRSRFDRGTLSLLVAEVFLPEFWATVPCSLETP